MEHGPTREWDRDARHRDRSAAGSRVGSDCHSRQASSAGRAGGARPAASVCSGPRLDVSGQQKRRSVRMDVQLAGRDCGVKPRVLPPCRCWRQKWRSAESMDASRRRLCSAHRRRSSFAELPFRSPHPACWPPHSSSSSSRCRSSVFPDSCAFASTRPKSSRRLPHSTTSAARCSLQFRCSCCV